MRVNKSTLTRREKRLLYILLCFLVLVGGLYLLVMPSLQRYQSAQGEYEQQQMQKQTVDTAIAGLPQLQDTLSQAQQRVATQDQVFYSRMENEQVDRLLMGMATDHQLAPVSLSIQDPQATELTGFGEEVSSQAAQSSEAAQSGNPNQMLSSIVNLQLSGERANLQAFVDALSKMPSLRVNGVSVEGTNYTLIIEVFMLDPLE